MALHPIPMPGTPLQKIHNENVNPGDAIIIYFEQQISYTVTQKPPAPPSALTPQLPYGTFFSGDYIGPFIVGNYPGTVITLTYNAGGSSLTLTITIQ
jgi:hypothetical protein